MQSRRVGLVTQTFRGAPQLHSLRLHRAGLVSQALRPAAYPSPLPPHPQRRHMSHHQRNEAPVVARNALAAAEGELDKEMVHFERTAEKEEEEEEEEEADRFDGSGKDRTEWVPNEKDCDNLASYRLSTHALRRQEWLQGAVTEELVEAAAQYLRATANPKLVSAEEEHIIFPVLFDRLRELRIGQMLDLVACFWARSTLVRYGTEFKDAVRDRIAEMANAAAQQHRVRADAKPETAEDGFLSPDTMREQEENEEDLAPIFAHEANPGQSNTTANGGTAVAEKDPVLASALHELDAPTTLRCVVVMGMSAGHRKRDVEFFRALGTFLTHHINRYTDPHELVHVLTAFARAKVIPSRGFLAMLSRRFPVVCKKVPLTPLPCYRAMVNFSRMGHENMSTYRFFADYMLEHMEKKIAEDKVAARKRAAAPGESHEETGEDSSSGNDDKRNTSPPSSSSATLVTNAVTQLTPEQQAKNRLRALTDLTPVMLTRWLLVLAKHEAPHQQYLRPLIRPVVDPLLPYMPPPSLTRLLFAMRLFRTGDLELIEPVIDTLCARVDNRVPSSTGAPSSSSSVASVCFLDLLTTLSILAKADCPVPSNMGKLLQRVHDVCVEGTITGSSTAPAAAATPATAAAPFVLRPSDMCTVASYLLQLQHKPEIPLDALDPLTSLMDVFAQRFTFLMELRVVSLGHVDMFADMCAQQQHPDLTGSIERMVQARKHVCTEEASAGGPSTESSLPFDGEESYYAALDIDVRDTFFKLLVVNGANTYGAYRPLPGPLQLDFRDWLTRISALDLLEAVDLYERACPGTLRDTTARFLTRSLLEKLGGQGEEVVDVEAHQLVVRAPQELPLTRADLARLTELVYRTPLRQVQDAPVVWNFVQEKARQLKAEETLKQAKERLAMAP